MNLTFETREGIIKHSSDYDRPGNDAAAEFEPHLQPTLEAQIIDLADEIAYNNHDIDDGLKAGYLSLDELSGVPLWKETYDRVAAKFPGLDAERQICQTISHLIGRLISDLVVTTEERLGQAGIVSLDDVRGAAGRMVAFSAELEAKNRELKTFLMHRLYTHYKVERMRVKSERFLTLLFECYTQNPTLLPTGYQRRYEKFGEVKVICDYIAGMTDRYALDEYKRLFEPYERV